MPKKLAPFGKKLATLLMSGKLPLNNVFIFIGNLAWQKGVAFNNSHYVLILPPETPDVDAFIWPVKGCYPLVFDTSGLSLGK